MNQVEAGLRAKLDAYSALTALLSSATAIWNQAAPPVTALPYVVFSWAGGGLENINPSEIHNVLYLVKAIADDATEAGVLQGHIKGALHKTTLTVSGFTNFYTACEDEVQLTETTREGTLLFHRGYYVRIRID